MDYDDKLKEIFSDFNPDLSSDSLFMSRLERSLNSVEIVKQHAAEMESRNRKAVAIAAIIGFISGFLFSLLLPALQHAIASWQLTLSDSSWLSPIAENFTILAWLAIAIASSLIVLNAYEVSLSILNKGSEGIGPSARGHI